MDPIAGGVIVVNYGVLNREGLQTQGAFPILLGQEGALEFPGHADVTAKAGTLDLNGRRHY